MVEVVSRVAFSHPAFGRVKRGDTLQVDAADPVVAKFLLAGYLYLRVTGAGLGDGGVVDSGRAAAVLGIGVGVGVDGSASGEEVTDGEGESSQGQEGGGGA